MILVIYAILAEQNIEKLFVAALIPGILAAAGYMLAISIWVRVSPNAATVRPRVPWSERMVALGKVWPVLTIFLVVVGASIWASSPRPKPPPWVRRAPG